MRRGGGQPFHDKGNVRFIAYLGFSGQFVEMSHRLSPLVFNKTVCGGGRMQKKKKKEGKDLPGYVSKKISHAKKSLRPAKELSCQQHPASSEQQRKWLYLVIGVSGCAIWSGARERSIAIEHVFHHFQEREAHCLDSCTLAVLS